jgi:hypothetical protein
MSAAGYPVPTCEYCGIRPGSCVGSYEGDGDPEVACDECCGHGCEDGRCEEIEDDWATQIAGWFSRRGEVERRSEVVRHRRSGGDS